MNTKPIRIQRSRQRKQVSPNGLPIVYVGRPSKWGNPIRIGWNCILGIYTKCTNVNSVLKLYKGLIVFVTGKSKKHEFYPVQINKYTYKNILDISELKGKNLSCWCKLGEPCHADILLKLANKK